jgi:archaellum component FlaD/FlaE
MFKIPRPLKELGLQTAVQLTLHFLTMTYLFIARQKQATNDILDCLERFHRIIKSGESNDGLGG